MPRNILVILGLGALLGGCVSENLLRPGGAPCDPLWDSIDYKKRYEDTLKEHQTQAPKPAEQGFGACAEDDLANRAGK